MFVPKAALSSTASLRNPRRRQRTSSNESIKPPSAKRQRSALRQHNPKLHPGGPTEHHLDIEPLECPTSDEQNDTDSTHSADGGIRKSIPIRTLKLSEKRKFDVDETVVLSKTNFYTVSQLPSLPDQVRSLQSENFRCCFASSNGYGLAVTQSQAIIWPYSVTASSLAPTDIFRLTIPESCKEDSNTIPLGIILSTAASTSPGLLVLIPSNGKIIYWETVSSAASLGLARQRQTGILGLIPGMLSGEYATEIVNGEPSGVIVTFSSGRVAHITLRDSQGKSGVTVNFLKNSSGNGKIGLLGGIRNALGGGFWRKDVAAVRVGESHQRGQRDIIIATSTGMVEIWDTHWNNGSILKRQFDARSELRKALEGRYPDRTGDIEVRVLDFSFITPTRNDGDFTPEIGVWQISVLVASFPESSPQSLSVVQLMLSDGILTLSTNPISPHSVPTNLDDSRCRLFVPAPGETAFVVIGQSVILLSLSPVQASPSSQLLLENFQPQIFQDSIHLRSGETYEVIGTGFEDQENESSFPACLLMTRQFGVIRIIALPRQETPNNNEDTLITAQHKMEQAVFYGSMLGNPLNLASTSSLAFPIKEIEEAALDICRELLQSTSKFIPTTAISVDQNLNLRAKALDDLSHLLLQQNKVFEHRVWWNLLWAAEKIAAQRAMWKVEERARKSKSKEPTFLSHALGLMGGKFKTNAELPEGTNDPVRHWFLYDSFRMEHIVPWIFNAIKPQKGNASKQLPRMSEHILEAGELSLAVLETAFQYRDEHANRFGIGDGYLEGGVLISGYEGLPEFWTSRSINYTETGHLLDLELETCRAQFQQAMANETPNNQTMKKIARNSARHLQVLGKIHSERIRWLSAQNDPKLADEAIATEQSHVKQRQWQLFKLAGIGQLEDAINLAESFRDMGALVELIIELQDQTKSEISTGDTSSYVSDVTSSASRELNMKISHYFEKFGEAWAEAFFSRQVRMGQSGILFSMKKFQPFISQFLHKNPAYSRLSWINDVVGERDYDSAAKTLETLALEHETDIWSHRVELSLAKLTKLAAWEESPLGDHSAFQSDIRRLEDFTEIGAVQEVIYCYVSPVLQDAIDQKAEIDLAIDNFASSISENRPSLHEILGEALANIVCRKLVGVDELVDLLTLIDTPQVLEHGQNELLGREFYLALRVIRLGLKRDPQYHLALQKLVWRRCVIKDNWNATGKTVEKMGSESESLLYTTSFFRTLVLCHRDRHSEDPNYPPLYIPSSPGDILLSDSDSVVITSRFRPERRSRITRDLDDENSTLSKYIENGELNFWFKNLVASSEKALSSATPDNLVPSNNNIQLEKPIGPAEVSTQRASLSWL